MKEKIYPKRCFGILSLLLIFAMLLAYTLQAIPVHAAVAAPTSISIKKVTPNNLKFRINGIASGTKWIVVLYGYSSNMDDPSQIFMRESYTAEFANKGDITTTVYAGKSLPDGMVYMKLYATDQDVDLSNGNNVSEDTFDGMKSKFTGSSVFPVRFPPTTNEDSFTSIRTSVLGTKAQAIFTWPACSGANRYRLVIKDSNGKEVTRQETSSLTVTITGLEQNKKYMAILHPEYVYDDGTVLIHDDGANGIRQSFLTPNSSTQTADISVESISSSNKKANIQLAWSPISGANSYVVELHYSSAGGEVLYKKTLSTTSVTISGIDPGITVCAVVTPMNGSSKVGLVASTTFDTPIAYVPDFAVKGIDNMGVYGGYTPQGGFNGIEAEAYYADGTKLIDKKTFTDYKGTFLWESGLFASAKFYKVKIRGYKILSSGGKAYSGWTPYSYACHTAKLTDGGGCGKSSRGLYTRWNVISNAVGYRVDVKGPNDSNFVTRGHTSKNSNAAVVSKIKPKKGEIYTVRVVPYFSRNSKVYYGQFYDRSLNEANVFQWVSP